MRILFVAFPESIHVVRWINQLADQGWDIHLFPSFTSGGLHPGFRNITFYGFGEFRPKDLDPTVRWRQLWPRRGTSRLSILASRVQPKVMDRSAWLARLIRQLKPDLVHSLEFQHACYLTLDARNSFSQEPFPPWAVSNWGSDIYLFGRLPEHAETIKATMKACDYYYCECNRDVKLAHQFGFEGKAFPVCPGSGGFDLASMRKFRQPGPTSNRRVIALKGYQNWAGRSLTALRALEMCADLLLGYTVFVYLASQDVQLAARLFSANTGIPVEMNEKSLTHEEVLQLHGRARISIGLSISDAISTSLLEAMVMGSFPIQSNTSCADEWLNPGESGIIVPPEDPCPVAAALRQALTDDELVNRAAEINERVTRERLDRSVVQPKVVKTYQEIFTDMPSPGNLK